MKGVLIDSFREVFVSGMAQKERLATMRGVPTEPRREEFVLGMVQRDLAGMKDVYMLKRVEFVSGMVQK